MKKNIFINSLVLVFLIGSFQISNAQSCASGNTFDLNENDFPQTCVTSSGAEGSPATATFDHDFATNATGSYAAGTDGINDVTVTLNATCSFPNGTNGTTAVGACVGPNGLDVGQAAGITNVGTIDGSFDFGGVTVNDSPCANCWAEVCYDFINGFSSTADGFDPDWSSLNGSTEGIEAAFGWVEGIDNTGAPFSPGISSAGLSGYCPAQVVNGLTASEFLTGTAAGGTLPPGVFGADAITGDGAATVCPAEEPASSSGPNSTVSTGMAAGAIPANWGLNPDDVITKFCIVYLMSNSNGDDCDGDGATAVNTSPSGNLSTVDFCVPPACTIDPATATNIACDDNGTPSDTSDDFITFDLTATGANSAAMYNVTGLPAGSTPAGPYTYGTAVSISTPTGTAGTGNLMLTLTDAADMTCTAMVMVTDPGTCESCDPAIAAATAPPAVITSESVCQADNVTLGGGVVDPPAMMCPMGSTLEYSLDMGAWSTMLPMYNQMTSVQIDTRCVCDFDPTVTSAIGTAVTAPGVCPTCDPIIVEASPICSADGTTYDIVINSITGGDGTGTDFTVTDGTTTITYPGTTMITGLAYTDQNTKVTLTITDADLALCTVDYDVLQLNCEAQEICDCTSCNTGAYEINAQAAGNGNGFSMLYVLIDGTGNVSAVNTTGNFPNLMDVDANGTPIVYEVYAINVLDGDLAMMQGAIATGAPFDPADAAFDAFCFDASCTAMFMENCECLPEPLLTCPVTVDLCGDPVPLNLSDGNVNTAGTSTVIYGGTAGPFIDDLGTADITDDILDPSLASAPGTYNLTVQLQSADGCLSPEVECIIIFTTNCEADGGKFDDE